MKKILSIFTTLLLLCAVSAHAQIENHVDWEAEIVPGASSTQATLVLKATISPGWHIYGIEMPQLNDEAGVPDPTTLTVEPVDGLTVGELTCSAEPSVHFDDFMGLSLPWLTGNFELRRTLTLNGAQGAHIVGTVRYMACNESSCTPPARFDFDLTFGTPAVQASAEPTPAEPAPEVQAPAEPEEETAAATVVPATNTNINTTNHNEQWWEPVEIIAENSTQSYWGLLILGFLGGLVALLTPCIWPMIPMTVSFFLKRSKSRARAITDAITYALAIIVIFLALGIIITLIFGPGMLNKIATGAVFNLIFFAMLVVFAISFFGAFEITLPSSWTNATDAKAGSTGGVISIFFMAFTLVLVSFSCTGPIIGTLLVEAVSQNNLMGPIMGMGGFALGLALPFGVFAFFPSTLNELPRSGSWLNTVKVVLGFIELILSLKFLSVADLAYGWHILDREVFLSLWIVLFALLGLYLLGKLRFSHDGETHTVSMPRFFMALASFAFAIYLIPGLWGAPLKAVSAFAPPLYTQDFNLYGGEFEKYSDYDRGMTIAETEGKPVLVDFSGYACVNCRKMEGAVFDTPTVRRIIEENYVMIVLMVDDKTDLEQPITVEEDGRSVRITTVGEKWSYLQRHKFGTNQQPFYVLLDNEGRPLNTPRAHDEDVNAFVQWLENGIEVYRDR